MESNQKNTSQPIRLLYLVLYLVFLFLINKLAFNQFLPLTNSKGLWFYSGASALILGSLLATPFFTSPANAISYLIGALVAIKLTEIPSSQPIDVFPHNAIITFCLAMLIICILNILLKDTKNVFLHNFSEICRILADDLGNPHFVYALVVIYALWVYHRESPSEMFYIGIASLFIISQQPLERLGIIIQKIIKKWRPWKSPEIVGKLIAHQTPGLLVIRQDDDSVINYGSYVLCSNMQNEPIMGVSVGSYGNDEGILIRAIEIPIPLTRVKQINALTKKLPREKVCILESKDFDSIKKEIPFLEKIETFVGLVSTDSSTERLLFEVINEQDLEQGRLVETIIGDRKVLYQVIDGLTKEDIIHQKNTYGFARAEATQVGEWDETKRKFMLCNWIPKLNTPVFIKSKESPAENVNAIGHFPDSKFEVELKNLDQLVTHNTAILGILGVGKSMLSIELVERMIRKGIKIVCVDLTNQYATELSDFYDIGTESESNKKIIEAGEKDKELFSENPQDGGSINNLREAIYEDLTKFITTENKHFLKIYNPTAMSATKQEQATHTYQDGNGWHHDAPLWQVTPVEITCVITESCLSILQDMMSDKARVCLVFEEAHSLIPEWNFVTIDSDKRAAAGTARAILQGRKYGLGCLLITQRTANVSKTILNQCNTIFAMRSFDETGKDFLSNYFGSNYANKLSTLKERHAIIFGRGSSCENPVMIRLNDQDDFRRVFRRKNDVNE